MNISLLMRDYLTESTQSKIQNSLFGKVNSDLPVAIEKKPDWEILENPQRLQRSFKFKDSNQVIQFIYEVLQYENEVSHNGSIVIEGPQVAVTVYTHTVDTITELDIEYSEELNKIFKDVKDYSRPEKE